MLSSLPFRHFLQIMLAATAMQSAMPGAFAQADPANEVGMANVGQMGQNALHMRWHYEFSRFGNHSDNRQVFKHFLLCSTRFFFFC